MKSDRCYGQAKLRGGKLLKINGLHWKFHYLTQHHSVTLQSGLVPTQNRDYYYYVLNTFETILQEFCPGDYSALKPILMTLRTLKIQILLFTGVNND